MNLKKMECQLENWFLEVKKGTNAIVAANKAATNNVKTANFIFNFKIIVNLN